MSNERERTTGNALKTRKLGNEKEEDVEKGRKGGTEVMEKKIE